MYKLEVARTSAITAEKRGRNTEDVQKRNTYRIAHGLQDANSQGLGGWTARNDKETMGSGVKVGRTVRRPVGVEPGQEVEVESAVESGDRKVRPPVLDERDRKPPKMWLGIW